MYLYFMCAKMVVHNCLSQRWRGKNCHIRVLFLQIVDLPDSNQMIPVLLSKWHHPCLLDMWNTFISIVIWQLWSNKGELDHILLLVFHPNTIKNNSLALFACFTHSILLYRFLYYGGQTYCWSRNNLYLYSRL